MGGQLTEIERGDLNWHVDGTTKSKEVGSRKKVFEKGQGLGGPVNQTEKKLGERKKFTSNPTGDPNSGAGGGKKF